MITKAKLMALLPACILCLGTPAQNFWQNYHPTLPAAGESYETSSALLTRIHSTNGHVWSSWKKTANTTGNYNFQIHVTDRLESYSNYPNAIIAFFNGYDFYRTFPNNCNAALNLMPDTYGVTVIESGPPTTSAPNTHYAVVAAFGDADGTGCMFTELNVDGFPASTVYFFPFPQGAINPSKPYVVNIPNSRIYFICGSYEDVNANGTRIMYAMRINAATGALPWTQVYDVGPVLEPRGMLISPYNANELVIVGRNDPPVNLGRRTDGFFMKLDATPGGGGNVLTFETIGDASANHNSEFMSVAPAFDTNVGPDGYVIGGLSDPINGFGPSWMLKVDQNGIPGGGNWNTVITGSNGNREITGVLERLSLMFGNEYYGVTHSNTNQQLTVFKLDVNGNLSGAGNNEFEYLGGTGPGFIMDINAGAAGFRGIQVAGTGPAPNYEIYTVKSWFSGESECATPGEVLNTLTPASSQGPGPGNVLSPAQIVHHGQGLSYVTCVDLDVDFSAGDNAIVTFCNGTGPSGNNNRLAITETQMDEEQASNYSMFPNPASSELSVSYFLATEMQVSIDLYNSLGQHVAQLLDEKQSTGGHELNVDLSKLNIENGIYFIKARTGEQEHMQKLVIAK